MIFLAQETFEAYKGIAGHPSMSLDNPFEPNRLLQQGNFFYPFAGHTLENTVMCLLAALVVLWVYHRVNNAPLFLNISVSLFALGAVNLVFFRTAFPQALGLVGAGVSLFFVMVNLCAILCVASVQKLPYFGLDEKVLSDPGDGSVRPWVMFVMAALVVLTPFKMVEDLWRFLSAMTDNIAFLAYVVVAGVIVLAGMVGNQLLPWRVLTEHPILGGGFMRELAPIFSMPGPATRGEVMLVGMTTFVAYLAVVFLFKEKVSGADLFGLFVVATLAFNIIRAELARSAKVGVVEKRPLRRSPWN